MCALHSDRGFNKRISYRTNERRIWTVAASLDVHRPHVAQKRLGDGDSQRLYTVLSFAQLSIDVSHDLFFKCKEQTVVRTICYLPVGL